MKTQLVHNFEDIISLDNLLLAWQEFVRGKRGKRDVQEFQLRLMDNMLELQRDLAKLTYRHGLYKAFNINDPKPRSIHKASVRDRLLHHTIYRKLYLFFDKTFISDSFSCRKRKGTHKALNRFREFAYQVSQNHTKICWVLKCDIRKFFANIDQPILMEILKQYIQDPKILWLLGEVVGSFNSDKSGKGLPLGNLTSQLLVNIYMNEFDQFVKHKLKAQHYIRYADDFVILQNDKTKLEDLLPKISQFFNEQLKLQLHPDKVSIKTLASGVDFLGWVHFPDHRVLRTASRKRAIKRFNYATAPSYLGLLAHGNTNKIQKQLSS